MFQESKLKTVIVFDTDDDRGMNDAYKIMSHLVDAYLMKQLPSRHKYQFGKIEFIKLLRDYASECIKNPDVDPYPNSLKRAKEFTDKLWNKKNSNRAKDIF